MTPIKEKQIREIYKKSRLEEKTILVLRIKDSLQIC